MMRASVWAAIATGIAISTVAEASNGKGGRGGFLIFDTAVGDTVLRLARSPDGLTFRDVGDVFFRSANAPDLVGLPDGRLLAMFHYAAAPGGDDATVPVVAISANDGRTWSRARPIRFRGDDDVAPFQHGNLVRLPGGRLRLYFIAE